MKKLLALIILQTICGHAIAEERYVCTIKGVSSVTNTGDLRKKYQEPYIEKQFSVAKGTGIMEGILQNSFGGNPIVVQPASKDLAYKVLTKSNTDHNDVYYLNIQDFKHTKSKPFIFVQSGFIFHGTCY